MSTSNKQHVMVALDLGNKFVKIKSQKKSYCFPTAMLPKKQTGRALVGGLGTASKADLFSTAINDHDNMYFGPGLTEMGYEASWVSTIGFGLSRYTSSDFKAMFEYALAIATKDFEEEMLEIDLVTGLPSMDEQNDEIVEYLADFLRRSHTVKVVNEKQNTEQEITYAVKALIIVPQYYGTLWDLAVDDDLNILDTRIIEGTVGVVDFGGGTTLVDTAHQLGLGAGSNSWQDDTGVDYFHRAVHLTSPLADYKIERIYLEGDEEKGYIYNPGNPLQIKNLTEPFMEQRQNATDYMKSVYRRRFPKPEELSVIFQTGGGANFLLENQMVELFDGKVSVEFIKDSQMANVRGYYKLGIREGLGEYGDEEE
ncbi:ParM/StbA family protein [Lactococcus petauri]|uniref:ParM/StbA family protein n=1 Tax=Lactococcus petauri TaxID=1940789 RepID=UPI002078A886|nr:ParM/StbA family protein [Lactococcus petauri]USI65314.1 ParM/StbA family protein [Lactococcus petauri]USI67809.1 ParM/StbA family protein [Lactococcus petauri]WJE12470.1 ParM/StbA family protein [Lactococcus petauri]